MACVDQVCRATDSHFLNLEPRVDRMVIDDSDYFVGGLHKRHTSYLRQLKKIRDDKGYWNQIGIISLILSNYPII